jgi:hypothetical protein
MGAVLPVGQAFFPLDEQLGLLSGGVTPRGEEVLVRLSTWMPFEDAREMLQEVMGIQVSKATVRRMTLAIGQAQLAVEEAEQERLQHEVPPAPAGAEKQAMSGDGAMVHLVGGEWAEVKTLALGEVTHKKSGESCTQHLSYFSRLSDASSFAQAALVETQRRGLERATEVCAVQDGAEWLQGLVDYHRADAVRILDFPHAAEYISAIGEAVRAAGGRLPAGWLTGVLHRLKLRDPTACSNIWPGWRLTTPVPSSRRTCATCRSGKRTCSIPAISRRAGPLDRAASKAPTSWWSKHGSKEPGCAGSGTTSIRCWCCATRCAMGAGSRRGRHRERSDTGSVCTTDKPRASSG